MKTLASLLLLIALALPARAQQLVPAKAQQAKLDKLYAQGLKDLAARNRLQLELAKMDVTIARDQLLLAQACESVAHENGWPAGTSCNPNNPAVFTAPAPKPKPEPPAPKAPEKKP